MITVDVPKIGEVKKFMKEKSSARTRHFGKSTIARRSSMIIKEISTEQEKQIPQMLLIVLAYGYLKNNLAAFLLPTFLPMDANLTRFPGVLSNSSKS